MKIILFLRKFLLQVIKVTLDGSDGFSKVLLKLRKLAPIQLNWAT
jgi:hypothetical protein